MEKTFTADVLICGAGASGLTLAIELARRGVSFRLIEKMETPFHGSRGKGIQPRTQEIFEDLGIIDRLVASGGFYPPPREYHNDGSYSDSNITDYESSTPSEPYHHALMVPQFITEKIMRDRLLELGHQPVYGCELVSFEQDVHGVTAQLAGKLGNEILRVKYLVGADGGRSFVRQFLQIDFPGKTLGVRALVADVALTGLQRNVWHRFNTGTMDRQLFICPLAGTELFQIQAPIPLEEEIDVSEKGLTQLVIDHSGRDDIRIQSISWISTYHMNARLADRYRVNRAFLIGDAAHVHPPTGGQGLNTSVQDAYNFGWKLAAVLSGAPDGLLDTYEEERRPIAADVLGLSTRLLDSAKRGAMQRGREVHQLDLGYRKSSLTLEMPQRAHSLRAGDRAPDAPMRGAGGQPLRLFELFKGTHWTLLGYESENLVRPRKGLHIHIIGARGDLIDMSGHFQRAYAVTPGDWILVRPDGYVAAIVASGNDEVLENYLSIRLKLDIAR